MNKALLPALIFAAGIFQLLAQSPVLYRVTLHNIQQHEVKITAEFRELSVDTLEIRMPNASPGRYAVHHFAKNIYDLRAADEAGNPLPLIRNGLASWRIPVAGGSVRFSYILFGDHADGTYVGIDNRKLHLNMPAAFVYAPDLPERPVELVFELEEQPGWDVATQLVRVGKHRFRALDYYYFYDSPTLVGEIDWRRWLVRSNDRNYTIELAVMHEGAEAELDAYQQMVERVVEEQIKIYGELPDFDFGRYTFLCAYNAYVYGDGMEHRNSTVCTSQSNLKDHAERLIGTISHEFFHAWNVERLRPASLEPFDFDRANLSDALWFAEGFTSYYDDLVLCRAGILSPGDYLQGLTAGLNYVSNHPGRLHGGPVEMSCRAPFVDAATAIDRDNFFNTFISYYAYGSVVGLALDLTLRTRYDDLSLDHYMRLLWRKYGKTEHPFTLKDLEASLSELTGDTDFAGRFFSQYVYNSRLPDFKQLFADMGLDLQLRYPGRALPELRWSWDGERARIGNNFLETDPAFHIGLNNGDYLLAIDGRPIAEINQDSLALEIGKTYQIEYEQRGKVYKGALAPIQNPTVRLSPLETTGLRPDSTVLRRRQAWLGREIK